MIAQESSTDRLPTSELRQFVWRGAYVIDEWVDINRVTNEYEHHACAIYIDGKTIRAQERVELVGGNYGIEYGRCGLVKAFDTIRCDTDECIVGVKIDHLLDLVYIKMEDLVVRG